MHGRFDIFFCIVLSNNFYDRQRKHQSKEVKFLNRDHKLQGNTALRPELGYRYLIFFVLFLPGRLMSRNLILYCADPHCGKKKVETPHKGFQSCA